MSILGRWVCACGCDDISDLVFTCPKCDKPRQSPPAPPQTKSIFIGLAGPAHVGKSTTMRAIHQILPSIARQYTHGLQMTIMSMSGYLLEQRSFATPLYEMVSAMTGRSIDDLKATKDVDWTAETAPMPSLIGWSPRKLLKHIGEFMRQTVSKTIWVERATVPSRSLFVVFDDARHDPEFDVCDVLIELAREGITYACDHPSAMPPDPERVDLLVDLSGRTPEHVATEIILFVIERGGLRPIAEADAAAQDGPAG